MNGVDVTFAGNLVAAPELRYTQNGTAVTNLRVAVNNRKFDRDLGYYVDDDPVFLTVECWDTLAEHCVNSIKDSKQRVIITGKLKMRTYETKEGEKRTVYEVKADDVALSLKFGAAVLEDATA